MDSPYLFHDNSMVFHAPVQRRPAAPQGHGGRAQPQPQRLAPPHREDQLLSRRALIGYASPRQDDERSYSPLPALPTVLRARNHLQPTPGQGQLSPLVAPPPAPAFLAPSYRPLTLARTTSASTKNALGFILDGSRARRNPFPPHEDRKGYHHEDTHNFHLHPDEIHRIPRMRDERSFKEEEEYPPFAASRYGTGGSHFPPRREDARGRLVSDDFADSSSYTSSPMPVTTARRSSSASVRPLDMPSAPAATESTKKKRKARICTTEGCTKYVVDHGLCIRHGGGKRCYIDGCDCRAQNRGLCWKHGGFTICKIDGCTKRAKSRGICWSHGGGTRCKRDDCSKIAVSNGLCWAHGGGKRCVFGKCRKPASERTNNFCNEHHAQETEV